jgi:hypothetical protein
MLSPGRTRPDGLVSAGGRPWSGEPDPRTARPPGPRARQAPVALGAGALPRHGALHGGVDRRRPGPCLRSAPVGRRGLVAGARVAPPPRPGARPAGAGDAPARAAASGGVRPGLLRAPEAPRQRGRRCGADDDTPRTALERGRTGTPTDLRGRAGDGRQRPCPHPCDASRPGDRAREVAGTPP